MEGAADAFYASLVQLDQALGGTIGELDPQGRLRFYDSQGKLIRQQGDLFDSPMHFIGFSRGTVVNSEIVQRLLTAFPNAGGTTQFDQDFHVTTIDPHDFDQESLELPVIGGFRNFYEPKVQTWEGITFADNYYQTTAAPNGLLLLTPNGRNIPNLLPPEDNSNQPGLKFPKDANGNLLGVPDVVEFLGTRSGENGYADSRAGFTRQTDAIPLIGGGLGGNHTRVLNWYSGSANLGLRESQPSYAVDWLKDPVYRRRSDGAYEVLFDRNFYDTNPNRVNPWYTPTHTEANFVQGSADAPWEGIGTGWFYSVLGGGESLRPETQPRVPLSFDNTYSARMRGDASVPTLFKGNFDAVTDPFGGNLSQVRRSISNALPGWSFHNGQSNPNIDLVQNLEDVKSKKGKSEIDYAVKLGSGLTEIVHNRFVVPDWGALRFDLHTPQLNGGRINVTLQAVDDSTASVSTTINLEAAEGQTNDTTVYLADTRKIGYGINGFETFTLDVPENLRGKVATLSFESESGGTAYLDNVFFKSQHLIFENPKPLELSGNNRQEARTDAINFADNYLSEKPQYALSYNDSNKNLNWVSYQLNNSWLGSVRRLPNTSFIPDETLPIGFYRVQPIGDIIENRASDRQRYTRGHMVAQSDRSRTEKDAQATYLMSNMLPQNEKNNGGVWAELEGWAQKIARSGKELYVIAGGDGQKATLTASDGSLIRVPSNLWKAFLILDQPGQNPLDVKSNAMAFAFYIPNDESVRTKDLFNINNFRNIDWLENQIGYDLFSIAILNDFLCVSILTYFGEIKCMFVSKKLSPKI
jgi:DNA/RNA endonuclease G (NUC1)